MKLTTAKFKRLFRIWYLSMRASLMARMAYRLNFFLMAAGVLANMVLTVVFVRVIFSFINNLAGWNYYQALMVVASYMLVEGLIWATCAYLGEVWRFIHLGTLDQLLVKPVDAQFLASISRGDPEDWMRVVTAGFVFWQALHGLGLTSGQLAVNLPLYFLLIFNAYIILYSISLMVRCIAFWIVQINSLWVILDRVTSASKYPTDIFIHRTVRIFFSTLVPLAFMATVPAKILISGPLPLLILASTALAAAFFYVSRHIWLTGLKNYSSASS